MKCSTLKFNVGLLLLLGAVVASVMIAGTKLGLFETIPGCGAGSGCDTVTSGPWGTVPFVNLPVSFFGLAWFLSLGVGWLSGWGSTWSFKATVFLGVLASFGFIGLMVVIGSFCKWCALAHACNILFWVFCANCFCKKNYDQKTMVLELDGDGVTNRGGVVWVFFVVFLVVFGVINKSIASKNQQRGEENIEQMSSGNVEQSTLGLLEGGHRIGSKDAPIQVVMFTDYQCPDCKRIEGQLAQIMKTRDDVSVVVKHFPLNFDCNDTIGQFKLHGNACWAARAAEAASIVGGQEAWEKMHTWLFSQKGQFTDENFASSLVALGFDSQRIINVMMGDITLETVRENCLDGKALGVYFTPMVFINGVEYLWYYGGSGSIQNTIDVVANDIANGNTDTIAPPSANRKFVEDWRRGRKLVLPGSDTLSWIGDGDIEFVVWSDYQTGLSKELDAEIKKAIKLHPYKITYTFRHFPIDTACNAGIASYPTKYDGSCVLAKLVIACDALGGDQSRWKMHDWLIARSGTKIDLTEATVKAEEFSGADSDTLQAVLIGIDVNNQMRLDILSKNNVWRKSIPVLMVDGRLVPRWRSEEVTAQVLFSQIIQSVEDEAVAKGTN
jgi:protein-disulfide isomerase/uncharacterized membrane protein